MRLLLADDSVDIADQLQAALTPLGHAVDHFTDGMGALQAGLTEPYDAAILDLGLPRLDGTAVLRQWRAQGIGMPVLILSGRSDPISVVGGLNLGADDYLTKPFRVSELVARLNALLRRSHGISRPVFELGDVAIDLAEHGVRKAGVEVRLTAMEFALLSALVLRAGQVVSRLALIDHLYAQDHDRDSNTLEVLVSRLRRKLGDGVIETVRGSGYRLASNAQADPLSGPQAELDVELDFHI